MNAGPRPSAELLASRLEFEELISDTSADLFTAPPDEVEPAVARALARVREFFGVDRCGLLVASADGQAVNVHLAANAPGVASVAADLNLARLYPWSYRRLFGERLPVRFTRLAELPPAAAGELEAWRAMAIRSALLLPLGSGEDLRYVIALNIVRHEYAWPDDLVTRLRVLGEMLVGALDRQDMYRGQHDAEQRMRLAADAAGAGLWILDHATGVFWLSAQARAIFGYAPDEVVDMARIEASVHPGDLDLVRGAIVRAGGTDKTVRVEYRIRGKDGSLRWIASRGRTRFRPTGEPESLMGISVDVTERRRAEDALHRSKALLASGAELAGLAFYEADLVNGTTSGDDRFCAICGLPDFGEPALGTTRLWLERLHPADRERVRHGRERLLDGSTDRIATEYRYLHPVEGEKWIRHLAQVTARDGNGRATATFGVLLDITAAKRAEAELGDLGRRLLRAQEQERALLARELHDDVTQRLAALAIDVGRSLLADPDGAQAPALRAVGDGLARISEDIHSLAYQLHPSVLTELGLVSALQTECERRGRRCEVVLTAELDPVPEGLGRDAALCLFRVAQEALSNVVRHAGARSATVALRRRGGGLLLSVRDDGVGFDPAAPGLRRSLGLASMHERLRLVNGTLGIESAPGRGTVVTAWVPMAEGTP